VDVVFKNKRDDGLDIIKEQKRLKALEKKIKKTRERLKERQRKLDTRLKILVGSYTMWNKEAFADLVESENFKSYFKEEDFEFIHSACLRLFPESFPQTEIEGRSPEDRTPRQADNVLDTQEESKSGKKRKPEIGSS
jgi:hypothetical protein